MKTHGIIKDITSLLNISESLKEKYFTNKTTFNAKFHSYHNKDIMYKIDFFLNVPSKYQFATIKKYTEKEFKVVSDKDYGFISSIHYSLKLNEDEPQEFKNLKEIFMFLNQSYGIKVNQEFKDDFTAEMLLHEIAE